VRRAEEGVGRRRLPQSRIQDDSCGLKGVDSTQQCPTGRAYCSDGSLHTWAHTRWQGDSLAHATEPGVLIEEKSWTSRYYLPGRPVLESSRGKSCTDGKFRGREKFCLHRWREDKDSVCRVVSNNGVGIQGVLSNLPIMRNFCPWSLYFSVMLCGRI